MDRLNDKNEKENETMITPERLMMPKSRIAIANSNELRDEVQRLRSEIKRLATDDYEVGDFHGGQKQRRADAAYLLNESEAE